MQKFENMDVIAALEAIMHQNTAYYQSDFAFDIKMLREAARSDQPEDKLLLWLSRPSGTFCFRERDVLLKDTQAYNTWKFCGEQTHDRILAYAVELTGAANGTVQGNLYELDYQQHFQHIRDAALRVGANRLIYESGMREIGSKEHFDSRSDKYFGEFVRYEMQPRDPELLQAAIRQEQRGREPARPGDFKEHLAELHTGLIEAEAQRIATDMKRLAAPNSPDKNHFMVEVSPYFTKLASSRDTDQLLAMLPYKSLHLSSVKDRFGIYSSNASYTLAASHLSNGVEEYFFSACITSTTSSVCGRHCSNSIALGMAFLLVIILAIKKPPLNGHHLIQEGSYQKQFRIVFNILSILLFQHKISKCTSDSTVFLSNAFIRNPLF